jgi:hypothetical protein
VLFSDFSLLIQIVTPDLIRAQHGRQRCESLSPWLQASQTNRNRFTPPKPKRGHLMISIFARNPENFILEKFV